MLSPKRTITDTQGMQRPAADFWRAQELGDEAAFSALRGCSEFFAKAAQAPVERVRNRGVCRQNDVRKRQ
jgi:hypothetical protein